MNEQTSEALLNSKQAYVLIVSSRPNAPWPPSPPPPPSPAQGSQFFWRSKESIDVAYHYNADEGLITISTRCPERGYNYPAIFVDASKIPISRADAVSVYRWKK